MHQLVIFISFGHINKTNDTHKLPTIIFINNNNNNNNNNNDNNKHGRETGRERTVPIIK